MAPENKAQQFFITIDDEYHIAAQITVTPRSIPDIPHGFLVCDSIAVSCCHEPQEAEVRVRVWKAISLKLEPGSWLRGRFLFNSHGKIPCQHPQYGAQHLLRPPEPETQSPQARHRPSKRARTERGVSRQDGRGQDDKNKTIADKIVKKLTRGITTRQRDNALPDLWRRSSNSCTIQTEPIATRDDIRQLGRDLWKHSDKIEESAADIMHQDHLLSSYCRVYLKNNSEPYDFDPDPSKQETQKRHDDSVILLSWIVNGLYEHNSSLALMLYTAVCKMHYWLNEATRLSIPRRRRIAELVILALRDRPIAISSESRVFHPAVFLKHHQRSLEFSNICTSLELPNLAGLSMSDSELTEYGWGVPVQLLPSKGGCLPNPGNSVVAPQELEDNHPNTLQDCGRTSLANEHTSSWLGLLAQAASQRAVGDSLPGAQESARAFVQTGNPDVMLGHHEASQSHRGTTPCWGKGVTNTEILMGEEELFSYQD